MSILFVLSCCTPYDSNKVNKELLNGKWVLTDVDHSNYDTIKVDYTNELTYLLFKQDSCIQVMPDLQDTSYFSFRVHNYEIQLLQKNNPVGRLEIDILTKDSLVLLRDSNRYQYKRIEL